MVEELTMNSSVQSEAGHGKPSKVQLWGILLPREEPDFAVSRAFLKISGDSPMGFMNH